MIEPQMDRSDVTQTPQERPMPNATASRLLGGPPLAVLGKLVLLSILVGVVLHAIGLDPWNIVRSIRALFLGFWDMGFDFVVWVWRYFLLGAVIVIPIWLIVRLAKAPKTTR
jgi:hypothetical protein